MWVAGGWTGCRELTMPGALKTFKGVMNSVPTWGVGLCQQPDSVETLGLVRDFRELPTRVMSQDIGNPRTLRFGGFVVSGLQVSGLAERGPGSLCLVSGW